jgi:hypothetical protein
MERHNLRELAINIKDKVTKLPELFWKTPPSLFVVTFSARGLSC